MTTRLLLFALLILNGCKKHSFTKDVENAQSPTRYVEIYHPPIEMICPPMDAICHFIPGTNRFYWIPNQVTDGYKCIDGKSEWAPDWDGHCHPEDKPEVILMNHVPKGALGVLHGCPIYKTDMLPGLGFPSSNWFYACADKHDGDWERMAKDTRTVVIDKVCP